jgi:hypothetical protein
MILESPVADAMVALGSERRFGRISAVKIALDGLTGFRLFHAAISTA